MKKSVLSVFAFVSLLIVSCGGGHEAENQEPEVKQEPKCTYSYFNDSTKIKWTAYKLTEKAGVEGAFLDFTVEGTHENEDPKKALEGATFSIETNSTETNDTSRNGKIFRYFFMSMNTPTITGSLKSFSEDGNTANIVIKMNEIEKEIAAPVKWEGEVVTIKTDINVEDWNGQDAIAALNKECKEKHTGTDGVSKLWPDVTIMIKTTLVKNCAE